MGRIGKLLQQNSTAHPELVEGLPFTCGGQKRQSLDKLGTNGERVAMHRPLRLTIDRAAIQANWRWLQDRAGVPAGAAVKADGYGLGARETVEALIEAGCRDFFVSTWAEASALGQLPDDVALLVLHGVGPDDVDAALASTARPCLNTLDQVARWKEIAPGRSCDVMVDTGMNRLGLRPTEIAALDGLSIDTLHSHLACADEDSPMNAMQRERFVAVASVVPARRYSIANSAGICLGRDYSFDLVRPGLSLYGGVPRAEAADAIRQVARVEAQVVQRRTIPAGETCGYGATFSAREDSEAAILNIGYADGYLRGFSSRGSAFAGEFALPVIGRVSMDLIAVGCDAAPGLKEGDWVEIDYDLPSAAAQSGLSQYELLTTLGSRFERKWA
jgi:alanine racemase